mmetsp:Transcript_63996/g.169430  ORF Transcript_63996/g.169430 Transcript_63996/m.169430 type:complete len:332 (-) Transcript_63996:26-1021(-)
MDQISETRCAPILRFKVPERLVEEENIIGLERININVLVRSVCLFRQRFCDKWILASCVGHRRCCLFLVYTFRTLASRLDGNVGSFPCQPVRVKSWGVGCWALKGFFNLLIAILCSAVDSVSLTGLVHILIDGISHALTSLRDTVDCALVDGVVQTVLCASEHVVCFALDFRQTTSSIDLLLVFHEDRRYKGLCCHLSSVWRWIRGSDGGPRDGLHRRMLCRCGHRGAARVGLRHIGSRSAPRLLDLCLFRGAHGSVWCGLCRRGPLLCRGDVCSSWRYVRGCHRTRRRIGDLFIFFPSLSGSESEVVNKSDLRPSIVTHSGPDAPQHLWA